MEKAAAEVKGRCDCLLARWMLQCVGGRRKRIQEEKRAEGRGEIERGEKKGGLLVCSVGVLMVCTDELKN